MRVPRKLTKLRLSDLNTVLASRPVDRTSAVVTAGGSLVDNTEDFSVERPPPRVAFIEAPRRAVSDRHVASREFLAQRRAEFEAMDDSMLELEITTLQANLENVRAQLKSCYLGAPEERDRVWQLRAERAAAAIKAEHTLASSELRSREQIRREAERLRRVNEDARRIGAIQEKKETAVAAQTQLLQMKEAMLARKAERHFAEVFVGEARGLLDPEIFQLLIDATKEVMRQ